MITDSVFDINQFPRRAVALIYRAFLRLDAQVARFVVEIHEGLARRTT